MSKFTSLSVAAFFVMFGIALSASADEAVEIDASHDASQLLPLQEGELQLEYNPDRLDSASRQVNETLNESDQGVLSIPLVDDLMNGDGSGQPGIRAWGDASGTFSVGIGSEL